MHFNFALPRLQDCLKKRCGLLSIVYWLVSFCLFSTSLIWSIVFLFPSYYIVSFFTCLNVLSIQKYFADKLFLYYLDFLYSQDNNQTSLRKHRHKNLCKLIVLYIWQKNYFFFWGNLTNFYKDEMSRVNKYLSSMCHD